MESTPPKPIRQRGTPRTPHGDHPELFIQRRNPSALKRVITPSKLADRLQEFSGLYPPTEIHNPATELSNAVSRAIRETDEALTARLDHRSADIELSFAKVIELVMWSDSPMMTKTIKRKVLQRRVAQKLEFPADCFEHGSWAQKSKEIIDSEVKKQNSRPASMKNWEEDKYDVYLPIAQATPKKKKRAHGEESKSSAVVKRLRADCTTRQMFPQNEARYLQVESRAEDSTSIKIPDVPRELPSKIIKQRRAAVDPFINRKPVPPRSK